MGSGERFVVAVAAAGADGFYVASANALDRLHCFYGANATAIAQAASITAHILRKDLEERGVEALHDYDAPVTASSLGSVKKGQGASSQAIALSWLASLSSLHDANAQDRLQVGSVNDALDEEVERASVDRLPRLVLEYIAEKNPSSLAGFRKDLLGQAKRRRSHEVSIDFTGSRVSANFGMLQAGRLSTSVALLKRRLWDLKVDRDAARALASSRAHEMLIQMPDFSDPQVTEAQWRNLDLARSSLEDQANQEELRFEAFSSVAEIGDRILRTEATG